MNKAQEVLDLLEYKIRFDTNSYVASHMKEPSGKGNWAFDVDGEEVWVNNSKYSDAKKKIQKDYGKKVTSVKVLP